MQVSSLFPSVSGPPQPQAQSQAQPLQGAGGSPGTGPAPPGAFQQLLLEALLGGQAEQALLTQGGLPGQAQGKGEAQISGRPPWAPAIPSAELLRDGTGEAGAIDVAGGGVTKALSGPVIPSPVLMLPIPPTEGETLPAPGESTLKVPTVEPEATAAAAAMLAALAAVAAQAAQHVASPEQASLEQSGDQEPGAIQPGALQSGAVQPGTKPAVADVVSTDLALSLMAAVAAQTQPVQPAEEAAPLDQKRGTVVDGAPTEMTDPVLESFVKQAKALLTGQETASGQPAPQFGDLVKLVAQAEQGAAKAGDQQVPTGPAKEPPAAAASDVHTEPQTQTRADAQTHARTPAQSHAEPMVQSTTAAEPTLAAKGTHSRTEPDSPALARADQTHRPQQAPETPDSAELTARPSVEPEQVVRQVARFVKVMLDGKQSEVRLNLHPEHLGQVVIKLIISEGVIKAHLVAQDSAVKAALEANLDQLKSRLTDQGFHVEQVHVAVGGESSSGHPQESKEEQQRSHQGRPASGHGSPNGGDAENAAQPRAAAPRNWFPRGTGTRINSYA